MDVREKQGPQVREQHQAGNGRLVNQDNHVNERGKNFRNPQKAARGWKKQEMNEHQAKGIECGTRGTEFSSTGEVSQVAPPTGRTSTQFHSLNSRGVTWRGKMPSVGQVNTVVLGLEPRAFYLGGKGSDH